MGVIAEDEALLKRAVRYLKKLAAQKQEEDSQMTKEEFFARVDEAKQEIADGKGRSFTNIVPLVGDAQGINIIVTEKEFC